MSELKDKILSGLIWQYSQRLSAQAIQLIVSIILARLLLPKDFGIVALIGVFITLSAVLVDSGFSNALIQKKEVDQKDYASVFILNLILSFLLYLLLFFTAPFIALFYEEPLLIPVLRIISVTIIFNAFTIIQTSILTREMLFKKSFKVNFISVVFSGVVGISMALNGSGLWSLVFSQVAAQVSRTILLWFAIKWKPSFYFSLDRISSLFSYGSKIMFGAMFNAVYNNVYPLIIGKQYNNTTLGYYNRGALIPTLIVDNISNTLGSVMFPALSAHQNDRITIKRLVKRMLITSSTIVFFLMGLLIVIAKPFVIILLTEKWLPAVPFLQLVCITVSFYPLHAINAAATTSVGKSGTYLKIEIIKKSLSLLLIVACIPFGVMTMVAAGAAGAFISTFISAQPNKKLIGYSAAEQWKDVLPFIFMAIFAAGIAWPLSYLGFNNWITMLMQICLASVTYLGGALLFKFQLITDIRQILKRNKPE